MGNFVSSELNSKSISSSLEKPEIEKSFNVNNELYAPHNRLGEKKIFSLTTIKKKLVKFKKASKNLDHSKIIREFLNDWSKAELYMLLQHYESLAALKVLLYNADVARPLCSSYKKDLGNLYKQKICTDLELCFQNTHFPAHRAILCARCSYFRSLLNSYPGFGIQIHIEINGDTKIKVTKTLFSSFLKYLYTGEIENQTSHRDVIELLMYLEQKFETVHNLQNDLQTLLYSSDNADCILIFSSENKNKVDKKCVDSESNYMLNNQLELLCHKAILCARSPFLRSLILRRQKLEGITDSSINNPVRIILDESVLPSKYAQVLLHALYLDTVDLKYIARPDLNFISLESQVEHDKNILLLIEEAMELFQIGKFLEFDSLSQGCENIIVKHLSSEIIIYVLNWSSQPHGSVWVYRQAMNYIREEFHNFMYTTHFLELPRIEFIELLKSDYLQASELQILTAVIKWSDNYIIKQAEMKEPNVIVNTAHSMTKKGLKKRETNDVELKEILAEFLPYIRIYHILPACNEYLNLVIKRGLISTDMYYCNNSISYKDFWIKKQQGKRYVTPRLFLPYWQEIKNLVANTSETHLGFKQRKVHSFFIPDTLYVVDKDTSFQNHFQELDVIKEAIPVLEKQILNQILKRIQQLNRMPNVRYICTFPFVSFAEVQRLLALRAIRDFNLPDSTLKLIEKMLHENQKKCPFISKLPQLPSQNYISIDSFLNNKMPDVAIQSSSVLSNSKTKTLPHSLSLNGE